MFLEGNQEIPILLTDREMGSVFGINGNFGELNMLETENGLSALERKCGLVL